MNNLKLQEKIVEEFDDNLFHINEKKYSKKEEPKRRTKEFEFFWQENISAEN